MNWFIEVRRYDDKEMALIYDDIYVSSVDKLESIRFAYYKGFGAVVADLKRTDKTELKYSITIRKELRGIYTFQIERNNKTVRIEKPSIRNNIFRIHSSIRPYSSIKNR